jgi:hypothetical protein
MLIGSHPCDPDIQNNLPVQSNGIGSAEKGSGTFVSWISPIRDSLHDRAKSNQLIDLKG